MSIKSLPATYMRGGTSRALIFRKQDLPEDVSQWDRIFLACLGSPDSYGRQLDGMGGGISSLSKVCVLAPSQREDADVDYTFAQVSVTEAKVDYKGNCGNVSSAVGPFAVEQGWCRVRGDEALVRIFNTNTQKLIHATFPLKMGAPEYDGELQIPGVAGAGAPIRLDFLNPGGAVTGRLLPTGHLQEPLVSSRYGALTVSMIDAANPCLFLRATELGLTGQESPLDLEKNLELLQELEILRRRASVQMGISESEDAAASSVAVPYVGLVHGASSKEAHFSMRVIASGQPHKALPLTVSLCAAVAARVPGTIVQAVARDAEDTLRIEMPSGILTMSAVVSLQAGEWTAQRGSFYRTARPLFRGEVFYRG